MYYYRTADWRVLENAASSCAIWLWILPSGWQERCQERQIRIVGGPMVQARRQVAASWFPESRHIYVVDDFSFLSEREFYWDSERHESSWEMPDEVCEHILIHYVQFIYILIYMYMYKVRFCLPVPLEQRLRNAVGDADIEEFKVRRYSICLFHSSKSYKLYGHCWFPPQPYLSIRLGLQRWKSKGAATSTTETCALFS